MMEEPAIREQLGEVRAALSRNEEEHEVLVSLLKGYEGWLRLRGLNSQQRPRAVTSFSAGQSARDQTNGVVVFRQAVLQVLKDALGEPLHVEEILGRAIRLGAQSGAKNPRNHTDLTLYKWRTLGAPVEKVRARTWRWKGDATNPDA